MSNWFRSYGFSDILDDFLIGAYPVDEDDVKMLEWIHVERILNLVEDGEYNEGEREAVEAALEAAGIVECRRSMIDYGGLPASEIEGAVQDVLRWLDEGRRVYLHCRAGWQRSAAVAAAVVAVTDGLEIADALATVRRRKPSANPLPHQRDELFDWWRARGATRRRADAGR